MQTSELKLLSSGLLVLVSVSAGTASADSRSDKSNPFFAAQMQGSAPLNHTPFTLRDLQNRTNSAGQVILPDGRSIDSQSYLRELNSTERELNSFGASLRSSDDNLGTVARAPLQTPAFAAHHPSPQQQKSDDSGWSHEIKHALASVKSAGRVTQKYSNGEAGVSYERTTTHGVEGRFLNAEVASVARFVQRVVRDETGQEQRDTQVYINGRQVFRRGRGDSQETTIWKTSFDVPLKSITVPVGPGSIDAKLGIRGDVNLDLGLTPVNSGEALPQLALDFKPRIAADGYISAGTTPTNIGEAGFEGAITLADNTLKVTGTAALSRAKWVDLKKLTIDNMFAGFGGRIAGYAKVKVPSKNGASSDTKDFEKEFYKWNGVKVEKRLYDYDASQPQPQPPAL